MLRQYLQGMEGVNLFGIISTLIFFTFFIVMGIHTLKMKKEDEKSFSNIPLEDENNSLQNNQE